MKKVSARSLELVKALEAAAIIHGYVISGKDVPEADGRAATDLTVAKTELVKRLTKLEARVTELKGNVKLLLRALDKGEGDGKDEEADGKDEEA